MIEGGIVELVTELGIYGRGRDSWTSYGAGNIYMVEGGIVELVTEQGIYGRGRDSWTSYGAGNIW